MIHVAIYEVGGDEFVTNVRIYLTDDSGSGIRHVTVRDRTGFTITAVTPEDPDCPEEYMIELTEIERTRFPLYVEAVDCSGSETEPIPVPDITPNEPCEISHVRGVDNPGCRSAGSVVTRLRNEILELCSEISELRNKRNAWAGAAAALAATAAALFVAAGAVAEIPIFGQIAAAILAAVGVALLITALVLGTMALDAQRRVSEAQERMRNARERFTEAAEGAASACCPGDPIPDLEQPECP